MLLNKQNQLQDQLLVVNTKQEANMNSQHTNDIRKF